FFFEAGRGPGGENNVSRVGGARSRDTAAPDSTSAIQASPAAYACLQFTATGHPQVELQRPRVKKSSTLYGTCALTIASTKWSASVHTSSTCPLSQYARPRSRVCSSNVASQVRSAA